MGLQIAAVVVLGLMCGSELNVAAFGHPTLNRQPLELHIPMRASLARLLGRVMPFWMAGSTLLNLELLLPFEHLSETAWRFAAISSAIQVAAVVFSLVGPVPINNRIAKWTTSTLPADWQAQERRWDGYHWFRTVGLMVGFTILILSAMTR
jgi:anthrone oxygenase-like protein